MLYFDALPNDLKELLLYYFFRRERFGMINNIASFHYLNLPESDKFWKGLYKTFFSSCDLTYRGMYLLLEKFYVARDDEENATISTLLNHDLDLISRLRCNEISPYESKYWLKAAARYGNLQHIQILHKHGFSLHVKVLYLACEYGYMDIVKYYIDNCNPALDILNPALYKCCEILDGGPAIDSNRNIALYLISKGARVNFLSAEQKQMYML